MINIITDDTIWDEILLYHWFLQLRLHIEGTVDIEVPDHEAREHTVYVFLNSSSIERTSINLPFHLRYQRGQITGG